MPLRMSEEEYSRILARNAPAEPVHSEQDQREPPLQQAAAAGVLAVALLWLAKRAATLAYWSCAVLATMYMYIAYGGMGGAGVALLALSIAMMTSRADSIPGRINAALTSAFWMLFAGATAIAALHRLGRRGASSRPLPGRCSPRSC
jgi:hypothetical protein